MGTRSEKKTATPGYIDLVDELGRLNAELAAVAHKAVRVAEIEKQIAAWCERSKGTVAVAFTGNKYIAQCSARKFQRKVNIAGAAEFLGDQIFDVVTVPLGAIDEIAKRLPGILAFVKKTQTGNRTIHTFEKVA